MSDTLCVRCGWHPVLCFCDDPRAQSPAPFIPTESPMTDNPKPAQAVASGERIAEVISCRQHGGKYEPHEP